MRTVQKNASLAMRLKLIAAGIAATAVMSAAHAATLYDSPLAAPGVYNGSGNPNEGFTVDTENGIELGLGVQYRKTGPQVHPSSTNVYNVSTGVYTSPPDFCTGVCALWNFGILGQSTGRAG